MTRPKPVRAASPCVNICQLDPASGLCGGCLRTIDEIAGWGQLDDADKARIWAQLPARRDAQTRRDGGNSDFGHDKTPT